MTRLLAGWGCCAASSPAEFRGYQFINMDTKGLHPGAMHYIFRGPALHNISGEASPQLEGKSPGVVEIEARWVLAALAAHA